MNEVHESDKWPSPIVYRTPAVEKTMGELSSRERLIEAGWRATDSVELGKAFSGATTARVSEEAGLTTGSFFHHFPNATVFAQAMVRALADSAGTSESEELTAVAAQQAGSPAVDLKELLRANLGMSWRHFVEDRSRLTRFRCQMRLWTYHHLPLDDESPEATVGDAIRNGYANAQDESISMWRPALEQSGLEIGEPFTLDMVAAVLSAIFEGLVIRYCIDPESVPPTLFANTCVAVVEGLTRPAGAHVVLAADTYEIRQPSESRSPQARSGAQRRHETRSRIVAASTGMFSAGWESVSATDVATRANVSTQTVTNLFGSVRAVAAATFARHAHKMYQNALAQSKEDPRQGLHQALIDLAVRSRTDPAVARALLAERINSALDRGETLGEMDVRLEVPVTGALGLWLGRMGLGGDRGIPVSTTLANFVLTNAIVSDDTAEEIAELALRLIPQELTASGRGARR